MTVSAPTRALRVIENAGTPDLSAVRAGLGDGLFLIRHDIDEGLLDEAYGYLQQFFDLPTDVKLASRVPGSNGQSGYVAPMTEKAERSSVPDWKELFHWSGVAPVDHPVVRQYPHRYPPQHMPDDLIPQLGPVLRELHRRLFTFQQQVLTAIGEAIGVHRDYFAEMLDQGPVVNRASWYPPMRSAPSEEHVWAVAHQDFDLITTLPRATTSGLEVLVDGEWVRPVVAAGFAVVTVGMVLERLTNGLANAALHRVVAVPGQSEGRLSIAQFCHPAPWTVLTPVTNVPAGERPRFPTLTADALFLRTMYRINRMDPPSDVESDRPGAPPASGALPDR